MSKFKVGDKVRVRDDPTQLPRHMRKYIGKVGKIVKIGRHYDGSRFYGLDIGEGWSFSPSMLEHVQEVD
jgi:hypothetical protein